MTYMADRHRVRKGQSAVASQEDGEGARTKMPLETGRFRYVRRPLSHHGRCCTDQEAGTPREWSEAASSTSGGTKVWVASIGDTQTLAINAPSRSRGGGTAWLVGLLGFRCLVLFGVEVLFSRGAAIAVICPRPRHETIRCISRDMATSSTPGKMGKMGFHMK